ncbi:hypothetical protein MKZ38_009504 [Zalerion maritima]|uniref:Uncharacterized protein n=1 Tax=Zalerion maritima TaxID=339359 RepID=A0AAD5S1J3_9PEZI|nr:hypothetical protein MKZ38_009504 [Zalerion maritima]
MDTLDWLTKAIGVVLSFCLFVQSLLYFLVVCALYLGTLIVKHFLLGLQLLPIATLVSIAIAYTNAATELMILLRDLGFGAPIEGNLRFQAWSRGPRDNVFQHMETCGVQYERKEDFHQEQPYQEETFYHRQPIPILREPRRAYELGAGNDHIPSISLIPSTPTPPASPIKPRRACSYIPMPILKTPWPSIREPNRSSSSPQGNPGHLTEERYHDVSNLVEQSLAASPQTHPSMPSRQPSSSAVLASATSDAETDFGLHSPPNSANDTRQDENNARPCSRSFGHPPPNSSQAPGQIPPQTPPRTPHREPDKHRHITHTTEWRNSPPTYHPNCSWPGENPFRLSSEEKRVASMGQGETLKIPPTQYDKRDRCRYDCERYQDGLLREQRMGIMDKLVGGCLQKERREEVGVERETRDQGMEGGRMRDGGEGESVWMGGREEGKWMRNGDDDNQTLDLDTELDEYAIGWGEQVSNWAEW